MSEKIKDFYKWTAIQKNAEAKLAMLAGDIKATGSDEFLTIYEKEKVNPGSFKLMDRQTLENGEVQELEILFIPQDKYLKVTEEKAQVLALYEGLVEQKTTYKINDEILKLDHVGEALSDAIQLCDKLSEFEKENLIIAKEEYFIKKGTISELHTYKNPREIFSLIQPICQLKQAGKAAGSEEDED